MLHFTCDLCGHQLDDRRYVAKVEVYPTFDPDAIDEDDLDKDHLQALADAIEEMELTGECPVDEQAAQEFRFDLCPSCQQRYVKDPLCRDALARLHFSKN